MHETAEHLAAVLEQQIENYEKLKCLALEKRKAVSSNNVKQLAGTTAEVQVVASNNFRLEEQRKALTERLAAEMGLQEQGLSLAQIADRLVGAPAKRLHEVRQRAAAAIREAQRQNRINIEMLKYSANLVDSVLKDLIEPKSGQITYSSTGEKNRGATPALLFDHRT